MADCTGTEVRAEAPAEAAPAALLPLITDARQREAKAEAKGYSKDGNTWLGQRLHDQAAKIRHYVAVSPIFSLADAIAKLQGAADTLNIRSGDLGASDTPTEHSITQVADFLAGPALVLAVEAGAAESQSPLAELIEAAEATWAAYEDACTLTDCVAAENDGREITEADEALYQEASTAQSEALDRVVNYQAATVAEIAVKVRYILKREAHAGAVPPNFVEAIAVDAERLHTVSTLAPCPVDPSAPESSDQFVAWWAERERRHNDLSIETDEESQVNFARIMELENLIRCASSTAPLAVAIKLRAIAQGFRDGELYSDIEKGHIGDEEAIHLLIANLEAEAHADDVLLALGPEFERRWALERTVSDAGCADEVYDAASRYTSEIADRINELPARTLAGFRLKARTVASCSGASVDCFLDETVGRCTNEIYTHALITGLLDTTPPKAADARIVEAFATFSDLTEQRRANGDWDPADPRNFEEDRARFAALSTPSAGIAGLIAKARMAALYTNEAQVMRDLDLDEELRFDIMNDLLALGGEDRLGIPREPPTGCPVAALIPRLRAIWAEEEICLDQNRCSVLYEQRCDLEARILGLTATSAEGGMIHLTLGLHYAHAAFDQNDDASGFAEECWGKALQGMLRGMSAVGKASDVDPIAVTGGEIGHYFAHHLPEALEPSLRAELVAKYCSSRLANQFAPRAEVGMAQAAR